MMKKNLFALLAAVSMIAPAVAAPDTVVAAPAPTAAFKLPEIPLSQAALINFANQNRTAVRCLLLCAAQNASKRVFNKETVKQIWSLRNTEYKKFNDSKITQALSFLSVSDYVMHVATYFLNRVLPSTSTTTRSQLAEFVAKEWSFVNKDKTSKAKTFSVRENFKTLKDFRTEVFRIFLKAGSRKQFFLPAESDAKEILTSPIGSVMMPIFEGLASDAFDTTDKDTTIAKTKIANMHVFRPISHAFVGGRFAPALAEDLLLLVSTDPKCPTMLKKFLSTDANWELAKNLLGQFFADVINKGIEAQIKTAEKA